MNSDDTYEYLVETVPEAWTVQAELNKAGRDGWLLCDLSPSATRATTQMVFVRPRR